MSSQDFEPKTNAPAGDGEHISHSQHLDDEQRVKVLSPGMLVLKRFIRNKLAVTGMIILVVMFLFSFAGALFMPYRQDQVFYKQESMVKDYAGATRNTELRYVVADGQEFPQGARARMILAINNGQSAFTSDGVTYNLVQEGADFYRVERYEQVANALALMGNYEVQGVAGVALTPEQTAAFEQALANGQEELTLDGVTYHFVRSGKAYTVNIKQEIALASMLIYSAYQESDTQAVNSYAFRLASQRAVERGEETFAVGENTYRVVIDDAGTVFQTADGTPFAMESNMIVNPLSSDVFLSVEFKRQAADAINDGLTNGEGKFLFTEETGEVTEYQIRLVGNTYNIRRETMTQMVDTYAAPSGEHLLGTDGSGMDMLTRLMYGGRISLLVGFVVVILEIVIGVIIGGVSGYFGGWVDTLMMRFVDLFNCIPYWPVMFIAGAVMDSLQISPYERIFYLMAILGIMGWTGIARVVRGQILALREQDFMVATEATGIRVSRRIYRHLVPNVMPLLIVQATMGLGGIIITEATLSFLGLGLKYPLASWGSIINSATNIYVMTNFWFAWIPAGLLILLTVLGFNFIGDGLRDAFDPKMKR